MSTPRKRAGARPGAIGAAVRSALHSEGKRLEAIADPVGRVVAVGDAIAALDEQLFAWARIRAMAVQELQELGLSYGQIATATGLSKGRVQQLVHDPRFAGQADGGSRAGV